MTGVIKNLLTNKGYGFIKHEGKEYFFHKDDVLDNWFDLCADFQRDGQEFITVEFIIVPSPKGPRAADVTRSVKSR